MLKKAKNLSLGFINMIKEGNKEEYDEYSYNYKNINKSQ